MNFKDYYSKNEQRLLESLKEFLKFKTISTQEEYKPEIQKVLEWLNGYFSNLGFKTKQLLTKKPSRKEKANPVFFAEYIVDTDLPTIIIYGHYDVQPPGDLEKWHTDPFDPVIKDGKIFGRGTNDNKGQVFANMIAIEYYINHVKDKKYNIKFFIEGEEEIGGITTDEIIESREFDNELSSDFLWISDGPWISADKPSVVYALRGIAYYDLYLKVMDNDIHSGIYGNVVLNPANLAGTIIYKLKDIFRNRIRVPGIYKKVRKPSDYELELVEKTSPNWEQIQKEAGTTAITKYIRKGVEFSPLSLTGLKPSLDVHGIKTGFAEKDGLKTIIPSDALVKFSIRLVPYLTPEFIYDSLKKYLDKIIPKGVEWELKDLGSSKPFLMDPKDPSVDVLLNVMTQAFNKQAVLVPEGGSIGLVNTFAEIYGPKILMPNYGLPDDGLHSPNEKFNLSQLVGGAETLLGFLQN